MKEKGRLGLLENAEILLGIAVKEDLIENGLLNRNLLKKARESPVSSGVKTLQVEESAKLQEQSGTGVWEEPRVALVAAIEESLQRGGVEGGGV